MTDQKCFRKGGKTTHGFVKFKTIGSFGDAIKNDMFPTDMGNDEQQRWAKKVREFINNTRPRNLNLKKEKQSIENNVPTLSKEENGF